MKLKQKKILMRKNPTVLDYNEIFKNINIVNLTPKYKLSNNGKKAIYTIIQLQDG
jgi:hypothetical protein